MGVRDHPLLFFSSRLGTAGEDVQSLEIDESLAEAHTALAVARWLLDWDWAAADRQFKRAIELNPNSADAHDDYSRYLAVHGSL
jgi:Tfp pilus assembly protein PilF